MNQAGEFHQLIYLPFSSQGNFL